VKTYCLTALPGTTACTHITHVQVLANAVTVDTDLSGAAGSSDADTAKALAGAVADWARTNAHTTSGAGGTVTVVNGSLVPLATAYFGD
jgi:hypothetical protein